MKMIITILLVAGYIKLYAQQPIDKLIATEKSFASTSKDQSTKKAFLAFVDSNCVGYSNGEQVNIFDEWSKRKEDSSKLTWAPEFAVISSSGDMGVTTGPWEYRQSSLKDTPIEHGHFTTIWQKKNGKWKAVFDMGISYPENITNSDAVKKLVLKNPKIGPIDTVGFPNIDSRFFSVFATDNHYAIDKVISDDSWFSINGSPPLKGASSIINGSSDILPEKIVFSLPDHSIISNTSDMLAVFGKAQTENKKQAYMLLWVIEDNEWKLLMMVIH